MDDGRNYVPLTITVVSNITMLVSHNVIFIRYFMPMSHGVAKTELVTQKCSVKKEFSKNSHGSVCDKYSFLVKLQT